MSTHPTDIAQRLAELEARILVACEAAGRPRESVHLLGASKTHPPERIAEAARAGLRLVGESRGQELRDKSRALEGVVDLEWHFIGHLQKNKVKYVVGTASAVHTVHDVALAEALSARWLREREERPELPELRVLVEVNIAGEASKAGVSPAACLPLCEAIVGLPGLALCGLMAIPPWSPDPEETAPWFRQLAALAAVGRDRGLPLHELSMGMSDDFDVAIREGATIVRVGTALFGGRG